MLFNATITAYDKVTRSTPQAGILNSQRIKRVYTNGAGNTEIEYDRGGQIQLIEISETIAQVEAAMNANNPKAVISLAVFVRGVLTTALIPISEVVIGLPNPKYPARTDLFVQDSRTSTQDGKYEADSTVSTILEQAGIQFTTTVNLTQGTNVISHNLGLRARFVSFEDSEGSEYTWIVNTTSPLNQIDVESSEATNNVTINVIAY